MRVVKVKGPFLTKRDLPDMLIPSNVTVYPIKKVVPFEGTTIKPATAMTTAKQGHSNIMLAAIAIIGVLFGLCLALMGLYLYKRAMKRRLDAMDRRSGASKEHKYRKNSMTRSSQFSYNVKDTDTDELESDKDSLKRSSKTTSRTETKMKAAHRYSGTQFKMITPARKGNQLRIATPSTLTAFSIEDTTNSSVRTEDDRSIQLNQILLESPVVGKVLTEKFDVESPCRSGHFDWNECAFEDLEEEAMWLPPSGRSSPAAVSVLSPRYKSHSRANSDPSLLNFPPRARIDSRTSGNYRSDFSPPISPEMPRSQIHPRRRIDSPRSILTTSTNRDRQRQSAVQSMVSFSDPLLNPEAEILSPSPIATRCQPPRPKLRQRPSTASVLERPAFRSVSYDPFSKPFDQPILISEASKRANQSFRTASPPSRLQTRRGAIADIEQSAYIARQS